MIERLFLFALLFCSGAIATPTDVTVRVLSKDAKFIGSGMNGVRVTFTNADTGAVLAGGVVEGSTGDTRKIMREPKRRGQTLSTKGSASFTASLNVDRPTRIKVSAEGPLSNPDSANTVTATQWLVPGKHIVGGDAWLLEMPGFSINAKVAFDSLHSSSGTSKLTVTAHVTMMCGCPIEPGGLWDADKYQVAVWLQQEGEVASEFPLRFSGKTSEFVGTTELVATGSYQAVVYAYNPDNGNTGADVVQFSIPK